MSDGKVSVEIRGGSGNVVIAGGGTIEVQGGIRNEASIGQVQAISLVEVRERMMALREALHSLNVPVEDKNKIEAELDTGLAQLRKSEPDRETIKLSLRNAVQILQLHPSAEPRSHLAREFSAVASIL